MLATGERLIHIHHVPPHDEAWAKLQRQIRMFTFVTKQGRLYVGGSSYTIIMEIQFTSLFAHVVSNLGSRKSFIQSDHQVDISISRMSLYHYLHMEYLI